MASVGLTPQNIFTINNSCKEFDNDILYKIVNSSLHKECK